MHKNKNNKKEQQQEQQQNLNIGLRFLACISYEAQVLAQ